MNPDSFGGQTKQRLVVWSLLFLLDGLMDGPCTDVSLPIEAN